MSKYIITGCAGFIGSSLAKTLCKKGYEVVGIDSLYCGYKSNLSWVGETDRFSFHKSSMNREDLENLIHTGDIVIHLACISSLATNQEDPSFAYTNNVSTTAQLLDVCRIKGVKHLIFSSTSAVYENTSIFPTPEDTEIRPNLIYSLVKKHCEEIITSFHEVYGLPYTTIRFFNIYGPHQDSLRKNPSLVPYLIDCFRNGIKPVLHSDGNQQRDYVYIDDLLQLLEIVINKPPLNTEINACSGTMVSVKDIVKAVQTAMNVDIEPVYRDPSLLWEKSTKLWEGMNTFSKNRMRQEVEKTSLGNPEKTKALVGWSASTTIIEGVTKLISTS